MNQNGLTANTTTLNEITGNTTGSPTGSDYPEDSCSPPNGTDSGGNVSQYSIWYVSVDFSTSLLIYGSYYMGYTIWAISYSLYEPNL